MYDNVGVHRGCGGDVYEQPGCGGDVEPGDCSCSAYVCECGAVIDRSADIDFTVVRAED